MSKRRKLKKPVTLFAAIGRNQHEALRQISFKERRSMAALVREALDKFVKQRNGGYPWAILDTRTGKYVGTYFPQLFGSRAAAAKEAVRRSELPVQVRITRVFRTDKR